jgi:tRNA threonylcarbamoyl adenosine modification protein YeaZ
MVREVMAEAGFGFAALDGVAVTVGPGSFTGVRIGLAAARGLALAAARPVAGVTTLEVIAHAARAGGARAVLVAIGAGRGRVYAQAFTPAGGPSGPPALVGEAEARAMIPAESLIAGDAAARLLDPGDPRLVGPDLPDAVLVAALAAERYGRGQPWPGRPPAAFYLRPPDARPMAAPRP